MFAAQLPQARRERARDPAEMQHVIGRVIELFGTQGPLRPVGTCLALRKRHADQQVCEFGVADLRLEPDAPGCNLRVEHRRDDALAGQVKRLEILACGVYHFARRRPRQNRDQGIEIDFERIDAPDPGFGGYLQ